MNNLEKAKEIIKENFKDADCGIFNSRNIVGDTMHTIYESDGLSIDICYMHSYFEVFGLTDSEYTELEDYYYDLRDKDIAESIKATDEWYENYCK